MSCRLSTHDLAKWDGLNFFSLVSVVFLACLTLWKSFLQDMDLHEIMATLPIESMKFIGANVGVRLRL